MLYWWTPNLSIYFFLRKKRAIFYLDYFYDFFYDVIVYVWSTQTSWSAHLLYLIFYHVQTICWRQISGGEEEDVIKVWKFQQLSFRWSAQNLKGS